MDKRRKTILISSLAAIAFSVFGVISALTADGRWYYIVSAVGLLAGGAAFAAQAIVASRGEGKSAVVPMDEATKPDASRT